MIEEDLIEEKRIFTENLNDSNKKLQKIVLKYPNKKIEQLPKDVQLEISRNQYLKQILQYIKYLEEQYFSRLSDV